MEAAGKASAKDMGGGGRAISVVLKFRVCPFLYTVNIILSPTDL